MTFLTTRCKAPLFLLIVTLTTLSLFSPTQSLADASPYGITSIDLDRNNYVALETTLWSLIERLDTPAAISAIFEMHHNFTVAHLPFAAPGTIESDAFIALASIYEWKLLEGHMMGVTNLFEVVRLTLEKWATQPAPVSYDRLELLDLAETIQDDSKQSFRVASTMDDMDNIMVMQNLYSRAMMVKIKMVLLSFF